MLFPALKALADGHVSRIFYLTARTTQQDAAVKMGMGRPRPEAGETLYRFLTTNSLYHSLPSGHTAEITGTCLALALWRCKKRMSLILGLLVALMGFSRIYLNHHFPSDVFFGWMFGSLAGWATYSFGRGKDSPYHE